MTAKKKIDKGDRFGRLKVVHEDGNKWICQCDCGNSKKVARNSLITGRTKSCGCLQKEKAAEAQNKHGMYNTRIYRIWSSMKTRCTNDNYSESKHYKDRGISLCKDWESFERFYLWATKSGYEEGLTIDRIDNNKGYSPDNCRWSTPTEQAFNRRSNLIVEYKGERKPLKQFSYELGFNYHMVWKRIKSGWDIARAIETPSRNVKRRDAR